MEQFFGLLVVGLVIWIIVMVQKSKSKKNPSNSVKVTSQSNFNLTDRDITITLVGPNGFEKKITFTVYEIADINLVKATPKKQGGIQFVLKNGLSTDPIYFRYENARDVDYAISEIQRLAETDEVESSQRFPRNHRPSNKLEVQPDGEFKTNELKYIAGDLGKTGQQPLIVLDNPEFVVVDLETTGKYPDSGDRIVEIAILVVNAEGIVQENWSTLINPQRPMGASEIHGIKDSDVANSPAFSEASEKVISLLENRIFVAHNASFDYRFLRSEFEHLGLELNPREFAVFDTMKLAKLRFPSLADRKMKSIMDAAGITFESLPGEGAHSALADAYACAGILRNYLEWNKSLVFDSVTWPLLETNYYPKFVTSLQARQITETIQDEMEFMLKVSSGPDQEILISRNTEVYFTGFYEEQEHIIAQCEKDWQITRAERVTKKRCSLVVTAESSRASRAVKSAMKWDIPVVSIDYIHMVKPE